MLTLRRGGKRRVKKKKELYFHDIGLQLGKDSIRGGSDPIKIGVSDREGKLNATYDHFWSKEEKLLFNGSWKSIDGLEDTFEIIISKKGIRTIRGCCFLKMISIRTY
ncbi:MAG: hypothetical protein JW896_06230 [Deltaproteobacteria bacterium]|nr:hypothetical protein [Deltaproteobacteria bacterium]